MDKELQTNILTLENSDFYFSLFAKEFSQFEKNENLYFTTINKIIYGVSFSSFINSSEKNFYSYDNTELAKWYLFNLILNNCKENNINFKLFSKFSKTIDIITKKDYVGSEIISIIPTYVNSIKKFGFIINYHFRKNDNVPFSIEVQKRSLSLDQNGNENKNFYIDKKLKIGIFLNQYFNKIFVIHNIKVNNFFEKINSSKLDTKKYQFGNKKQDISQFQGVKKFGPYLPVDIDNQKTKICFLYQNSEKNYSYKLYNALEGKSFPTFAGMEKMFKFPMNKNTVIGRGVEEYTERSIEEVINELEKSFQDSFIVPILIVPWNKETATEEQVKLYYKLKYLFLTKKMPSQFVSISKIKNDNILKWSVSSIAIQLFSKLGGSPWVVIPKTNECLIIGIGQTYKKDLTSKINRYFSYSILTDTTGLFKGIKILANTNNTDDYAKNLSVSLKEIISKNSNQYSSFVIHTSFRMNNKDIKIIKSTLDEIKENTDLTFAVLRFDDNHDYLFFDKEFNSLVPLESTKVALSYSTYLVWFEGQQYGNFSIRHRIGAPMKIKVDYPNEIKISKITDFLQDAINLSGANWRGFNAKSIPISLLYAELISKFVSSFNEYGLEPINIENITPWFL